MDVQPFVVFPCLRKDTLNSKWTTYAYIYTGWVQQPYSVLLVQDPGHGTSAMGVMKMGNIVPRAGIKPIYLAFRASVLPSHHIVSPLSPRPPVYATPYLRGLCRLLHS